MTEFIHKAIDFLTDPSGVGLPILIGSGLAVILYLMKYTTKEWKKTENKQEDKKEKYKGISAPFKPF